MAGKRKVLKPIKRGKIPIKDIRAAVKLGKEHQKFRVHYLGEPRIALDNAIAKMATKQGYEFYASGYNFKTKIRDIAFEERIPQ